MNYIKGTSRCMYERLVLQTLSKFQLVPNVSSKLHELRMSHGISAELMKIKQEVMLTKLVYEACKNSVYYRNLFTPLGFNSRIKISLDDLQSLPILEKETLRNSLEEICPRRYSNDREEYRTGGTTGDFLKIYVPKDSRKSWSMAAAMRAWEWVGFCRGDRYIRLWGLPVDVGGKRRTIDRLAAWAERKLELNAFLLSEEQCADHVKRILRFKPRIILSHATPLMMLAKYLQKANVKLNGLEVILTTAEMLLPSERLILENVFNCSIFDYYGNRETNIIAAQCEVRDGYHVASENGILEIVGEDGRWVGEGEVGDVLITDFRNHVMPLIRYRIGDMAVATYKQCICGRNLPLVKRFVGRKLESIRTRAGRVVPGEFFLLLFDRYKWIYKAQVVQESLDLINIYVDSDDMSRPTETDCRSMREQVRNYLGEIEVTVSHKSHSEFQRSGKHRWVISKI